MVWTVFTDKHVKQKAAEESSRRANPSNRSRAAIPVVALALIIAVVLFYFVFFREVGQELHPIVNFEDRLQEVCRDAKLPMPIYEGPKSFFKFILNPEKEFCYSWIQFGGEKQMVPHQKEEECNDEIRKEKFICFNEEYKMNFDPCVVYSFGKDLDNQFERDMNLFSCDVHAFDHDKVTEGEHLKRADYWYEHSWDIAEYPYDVPAADTKDNRPVLRRSIDFITTMLGHKGKEIKYVKSDLQGREWILLKQIVTYQEYADFRQIGVRLHMPVKVNKLGPAERNETFYEYFKVLQGLTCSGYRYVLGRPVKYYRGGIKIPEVNTTLYPAYEINFVKDLNI